MIELAAVCEGKSERLFCEQLLKPHLKAAGIAVSAIEVGIECKQSGGNVSFERILNDVRLLLSEYDYVTTLVDFFRLGAGWSGLEKITTDMTSGAQAEMVEEFARHDARKVLGSDATRFIPNVLMHEFEALLFSDPGSIVAITYARSVLPDLMEVASKFSTPEDINTGRATAPSKRLVNLKTNYGKIAHGPRIAARIGLTAIRAKCPHFNSWLESLEQLRKDI